MVGEAAGVVRRGADQQGGQVIGKFNYSFGITDWSPQIASIKALPDKPDVIHVCGVLPDVGILIRQLRANGYDGWVAGCDGFDDPSLESTVGNPADLDKVIFATHGVIGDGGSIDTFLAECKAAGFKVNGIFDALGGDMVAVVAAAAKKAGSADPVEAARGDPRRRRLSGRHRQDDLLCREEGLSGQDGAGDRLHRRQARRDHRGHAD